MASKRYTLQTTVYRVSRGPVSGMGNPSYIFHTSDGELRTTANLGKAYALENDFRLGETLDVEVELTVTITDRVTDWRKL